MSTLRDSLAWDLGHEAIPGDPLLPLPPGTRAMDYKAADAAIARLSDPACKADIEEAMRRPR